MKKRTTPRRKPAKPAPTSDTSLVYHAVLGRSVPTYKRGGVRLANGPICQPATVAAIENWQRRGIAQLTIGEVIDRLANHATATGFQP